MVESLPTEAVYFFRYSFHKIQEYLKKSCEASSIRFSPPPHLTASTRYLETMSKLIFKSDKHKNTRGGYSRLLQISCQKCDSLVCLYQKDGPGNLRRMYIDRILENKVPLSGKNLVCLKGDLIGVKTIYRKENRPAFRLFVDSVKKKIIKHKK